MKSKLFYLLACILFQCLNADAQSDTALKRALHNTFRLPHLNYWSMVNIADGYDTLGITEGFSGDTTYMEIEGQSKMVTTKKSVVLVDEYNRMIYAIPRSSKNKRRYSVKLPDSMAMTLAVPLKDSFSINKLSEVVYEVNDNGSIWKIAVDGESHLVKWMETIQTNIVEDIKSPTYKEKEEERIIRLFLDRHIQRSSEIRTLANPGRFIQATGEGYKTVSSFNQYELIDLFN